jgi:lambda family phage portal protein
VINPPQIRLNLLDRAINAVSPAWGEQRITSKLRMAALASGGFVIPGGEKKSVRAWTPSANHVDQDTLPVAEALRAGSRDMWMNTPIAVAALKRMRTNVVGFGLSVQARPNREFLGLTPEAAEAWEENVEREFALWSESKDCDVRRTSTFRELQGIALLSTLMSGDCFAILPAVKRPGVPYDLRIQLLEADTVSNPPTEPERKEFSAGVKTDSWGAPVAYYFRTEAQDTSTYMLAFSNYTSMLGSWKSVPAFGGKTGRRNVLHMFEVDRPGQRRGVPFLAPVLETLKQLTRLTEAELMAAVVTSYLTVFVKNVPSTNAFNPGFAPSASVLDPATQPGGAGVAAATRPDDANMYQLGNGSIMKLAKDQDVTVVDPKRPNGLYAGFFEAIVKQIGAALEIPYEILLQVFGSSYSASRAALLEGIKFFSRWEDWVITNFCQPSYEEWLTEAILKGRVSAPGFLEDPAYRAAWCATEWHGPGRGQLDPLKETQAALARISGNLSTHEAETLAINGAKWDGVVNRLGREKKVIEANDLVMAVAQNGQVMDKDEGVGEKKTPKKEDK